MATVGVLLAIRVPANLVGWLLLVSAVVLSAEFLGRVRRMEPDQLRRIVAGHGRCRLDLQQPLRRAGPDHGRRDPADYPNGRLLAALAVAGGSADLVARHVYRKDGASARSDIRHDLREPVRHRRNRTPCSMFSSCQMCSGWPFVGAIASVVIRYRRAGHVERQQLKWLIEPRRCLWSLVGRDDRRSGRRVHRHNDRLDLRAARLTALPIAIGIAVLRYRLYEIDRIISRTIAWALVTGVLVAVFASVVVMLQAALVGITQGRHSPWRGRRSSRWRSSSRCGDVSSTPWTGGSIAPGTTANERSRRSPGG